MTSSTPFRGRLVAVVATTALALSACGSSDDIVSTDDGIEEATPTADAAVDVVDDVVDVQPAGLQQVGPISVDGAPLAPYDSTLEDLTIGTQSPIVSGESFDGTPVVLGAPTENPTLIVFLAHWCPHCNEELPVIVELGASGQLPDGLDVVGVSTAVSEERDNYPPSDWIDDNDWTWPTMADDIELGAISALGGTSFPFAVVLDSDGTVLARRAGQATAEDTVSFVNDALASAS